MPTSISEIQTLLDNLDIKHRIHENAVFVPYATEKYTNTTNQTNGVVILVVAVVVKILWSGQELKQLIFVKLLWETI